MFDLTGKVAIVTGASRGIGRATAEALAEQGALVVVDLRRGEAQAAEVVEGIRGKGGKAEALRFDVASSAEAEAAIADVARRHGRLDILVANAGISMNRLLMQLRRQRSTR